MDKLIELIIWVVVVIFLLLFWKKLSDTGIALP